MTGALGHPHIHLDVVDSTNALAKEQATAGAAHGTTFTASQQTAGRGRHGRSWVAPAGSALLMSVILRPAAEHHRFAPLAAALAVAETCEQLADVRAQIKWPNDVWIEGRKVSGILVEARPNPDPEKSWVVVGIGLNTRVRLEDLPEELQQTATSLSLGEGVDALTPLLARLEQWIAAPTRELIQAWSARDALRGRDIAWAEGEGIANGIDDEGNLLVRRCGGGISILGAGEVHLSLNDPLT
ncbi:MAG: biotin--[acetyl-CoA-carboxylase] ligase [Thermoleophilaceae bacterium]|nr:biotin--[acetyl-CoA-carboxylase] ligase [Thermoleophilaceae bacterium]